MKSLALNSLGVFYFFLNLFLIVDFTYAQEQNYQQTNATRMFNNFQYEKINNQWYVKTSGSNQFFKISSDLLSVKFKQGVSEMEILNFEAAANFTRINKNSLGWYHYQFSTSTNSVFDYAESCLNNSLVDFVDIPSEVHFLQTANDPVSANNWYFDAISLPNAWNIETGSGSSIVVAIIDSGIDWSQEDLGLGPNNFQNIYLNAGEDAWSNPNDPTSGNGIDDDGNGYIDDWKGYHFGMLSNDSRIHSGHGTRVSSIISAKTNNGTGISGVAGGWGDAGVKILPCATQTATYQSLTQQIALAILYATNSGARIINMSLGQGPSIEMNDAIEFAHNNNVLLIASAGNSGQSILDSPANHPYVMGITGTDMTDSKVLNHSYGTDLDIGAPGIGIWTAEPTNSYNAYTGTSFSAPIVSGVAALMLTQNPCLGPRQITDLLNATADKTGGYYYNYNPQIPGKSFELGYGRLNAFEAVKAAQLSAVSGIDLYMRDRFNDNGNNAGYQFIWDIDKSPDIWVRNNPDGLINQVHEAHSFEFNPQDPFYVYVRIGNKGCTASTGMEILRLYSSVAATNSDWPQNWDGINSQSGAIIGTQTIPVLHPGESVILEFPWSPFFNMGHCLLARIENSPTDSITVYPQDLAQDVYQNNNIAARNVFLHDIYPKIKFPIYDGVRYPFGEFVFVGNVKDSVVYHDIYFKVPDDEPGKPLTEEAEVVLLFDDEGWNVFSPFLANRSDVRLLADKKVRLLSDSIAFMGVPFGAKQRVKIYVGYSFLSNELTEKSKFGYEIFQKYSNIDPVIGEHWTGSVQLFITKYPRNPFEANAGNNQVINKGETITLSANLLQEDAQYNWYDMEGNLIYSGSSFSTVQEITKKFKLEIIADVDGVKDYDDVEISVNPFFITTVSPNPANHIVTIGYDIEQANSAYLILTNSADPAVSFNYILNSGSYEKTVDISNFSSGVYTISLICNGTICDSSQLIIN